MRGDIIHNPKTRPSYGGASPLADMAFSANLRARDVDMLVSNRVDFGHLLNPEDTDYQMEGEYHKPATASVKSRVLTVTLVFVLTLLLAYLFLVPFIKRSLYSFTGYRRVLIVREKNFKFV